MDISAGLIAKGTLGTAAAAGAGYLGYNHKDQIASYLWPKAVEKSELEVKNEKIVSLGIDAICKLNNLETAKECELEQAKLEQIKFSNRGENNVSVSGLTDSEKVKLKIEKTDDTASFPEGIKFTFKDLTKDISVKKDSNDTTTVISLKQGTNPEFKIVDGKLKRAWEIGEWAKKVGLKCPKDANASQDKCTLEADQKINIKEDSKTLEGATFNGGEIKFEKDQKDHNQGFRFTVENEITLQKDGTSIGNDGIKKIIKTEDSKNFSYEIVEESGKWFLSRKEITN